MPGTASLTFYIGLVRAGSWLVVPHILLGVGVGDSGSTAGATAHYLGQGPGQLCRRSCNSPVVAVPECHHQQPQGANDLQHAVSHGDDERCHVQPLQGAAGGASHYSASARALRTLVCRFCEQQ